MIKKINVSTKSTLILSELQHKLKLRPNILARNAFMLSMENGDRYSPIEEVNISGKEFNSYTLFGTKEETFEIILRQYYGYKLNDRELIKVISFHVEKGLKSENFLSLF